ncbi:MAG: 4Fe-4S dicluster domain-containing protein [Candidatus Abyssobacteria bacterium SURF_5]|uniref:4Fe-4S dicluster domain-containing protein n=1 Tax=Abyssobacteria bacterium (strain SURF_5) TaxID=2093360 RepID=A0A3A4NRR3_ABYX5|nr:MAG: 4Fe-4S dicluster domain-containing protein [Candidatus Abyssubacteria bacterium SURF_5]
MTPRKASKQPKKAILLVGSGYGALKAAEDLAQSGIPVVWVTNAPHFLKLPGGTETFSEWPDDINFQFRPLYLRVTRHPLVTPLTGARLESLEQSPVGIRAVVTQNPQYIDYDLCTGCGRCMEVCPLNNSDHPPLSRSPAYCPSRALELNKRKLAECRVNCPLGVNVQAYMALAAASRFEEALRVIKEDNPLPGICGRVCHHPCEASCRRKELDEPIAIRDVKRFLADYEAEHGPVKLDSAKSDHNGERVAIIGSGPAGLTAAHFLNRAGFSVTVFEALPEAGGMLRAGINSFRLPRKVLDAEVLAIAGSGVEIRTGHKIDSAAALLKQGFKAILLATGTHEDLRLNIPGEDFEGIEHCVAFLSRMNLYKEGRVKARTVVIGAGNSAMDAARTALRLGAEEVTILAIERENEMPAHPREIREAREEGVKFVLGAAPVEFEGAANQVNKIICRPAHWSEPDSQGARRIAYDSDETFAIEAETVIVAIGQRPHLKEFGLAQEGFLTDKAGRIQAGDDFSTSIPGVFAAGDVVTGPSTVIGSMASGRKAAAFMIEHLTRNRSQFSELTAESRGVGEYVEISEDIPKQSRPEMAQRQPKVRRRDFEEVDFGLTPEQAVAEAKRCLQCGACCECRVCESVCTDIGAIDHFREGRRFEFSCPSVIIADSQEIGSIDHVEGKRIFHLSDLKAEIDLVDVLVSGSSAAGRAMTEAAPLRVTAIPNEVEPPEPAGDERLGIFICNCNGAMAPKAVMDRIMDLAARVPSVAHSEIIFSACHPRGADQIARSVREKRLNRVILGSCVCCPLEFQCISCNDQRTRARIHLFDRLGLPRNHFEMINIKDHLLPGGQTDDEIFEKAREILKGALIRVHLLGRLRQGITEIGKNIMILGGSEVGISCAMNLSLQGFHVRLIHKCTTAGGARLPDFIARRPIDGKIGRSITHVEEAEIQEISGHLGDFRVSLVSGGVHHTWRASVICLTDENVLPLAIQENMMGLKKLYRYNFAFFHTPQLGLYRVLPRTLKRVNAFEAGTALAAEVATVTAEAFLKDHELSPRVDPELCRGCGRCAEICPFNAIKMVSSQHGIYTAEVIRHNCVGCGGCVGRCPVTAMDIPYFSNQLLEDIVMKTFSGER